MTASEIRACSRDFAVNGGDIECAKTCALFEIAAQLAELNAQLVEVINAVIRAGNRS